MINRSGVIALVIAGAIVAWGAFYKDDPEPAPARHQRHQETRRHDGAQPEHGSQDGGMFVARNVASRSDAGAATGRFDGPR